MKRFIASILILSLSAVLSFAAALDGKWDFTFETENGVREAQISLQVQGTDVKGKVQGGELGEIDVTGTFTGDDVTLVFPYYSDEAGVKADVKIKGKLDADTIKGGWQFESHGGDFAAKRAK